MPALTIEQALQAAIVQHQAGHLGAAETIYRQILSVQPHHADALHLLGAVALMVGRYEEAVDSIRRAVALSPGNPVYESNLGEAYRRLRRFDEAIVHLQRAVDSEPDYADAWTNLGSAFAGKEQWDQAITCFQRTAALCPSNVMAQNNLALALTKQGRTAEAILCYRQVVALLPHSAEAYNNLAHALLNERRWNEAIAGCEHAIALQPRYVEAHGNLGVALLRAGRHAEAIACDERAVTLAPNSVELQVNLAAAYLELGEYDRALAACESALAINPLFAPAHWTRADLLLRSGCFKEGWREYEWRWQCPPLLAYRRHFAVPQWDGTFEPGTTILAHAEQGYGDAIQFLRYVKLLRQQPGVDRVILECGRPLVRLFASSLGDDVAVFPRETWDGHELPPFDRHIPLHSLPLALDAVEPMPMPAYLHADPHLRAQWRQRLGPGNALRVGLAWTGNPDLAWDCYRSIPPEKYLPLLKLPGARFYSLQVETRNDPPQVLLNAGLIDLTAQITDFMDTAALISELDLIISADSVTVHLAGALGRPVWALLAFVPDWRWGREQEGTPWYSTARLFRQPSMGDWDTVMQQVGRAWARLTQG